MINFILNIFNEEKTMKNISKINKSIDMKKHKDNTYIQKLIVNDIIDKK